MPPDPSSVPREPGWGVLGLYALPALGLSTPAFFVRFYFLAFATDALGIAPATVGALLAGGRLWDAVTDPAAGWGSDRTRSRWGRRRPWIALAAPLCALTFFALWNPPAALETPTGLLLWSATMLFLFTAASAAWEIPHQALGAELSDRPDARPRIFGLRYAVGITGAALSFGGMQIVGTASDPRATAGALAGGVALAMGVSLVLPALALRERGGERSASRTSPWRATRELLARPSARRLLGVWFLFQMAGSSQALIAPYMSTYVIERPELVGVMPALFIGPAVASVPLWVLLSRHLGQRRVWLASMLGASVSYALLFALPPGSFIVTGALLAAAGFWTGCGGPVAPSLFASLVDEDARASGERREGLVFAAKEFVEKASGASVALVIGVVLQLAAFEPNVAQSDGTRLAIRACLGLLPGAAVLLAALLLRGLSLGDREPSAAPLRAATSSR